MKILLAILITFFSLLTAFVSFAQEQKDDKFAVTVSPVVLSIATEPGKSFTTSFKVTNDGSVQEDIVLGIKKINPRNSQNPEMLDVASEDPFLKWINFSSKDFLLEAKSQKTVQVTITPDTNAGLGYYYAITVTRKNALEQNRSGTNIRGSIAIPLIMEVKNPTAKREIKINSFNTKSVFYEFLPSTFYVGIQNSGNIHISPKGTIFIEQNGNEVGQLSFNAEGGYILPNTSRTFEAAWEDGFGNYTPKKDSSGVEIKSKKGEFIYTNNWDTTKLNKLRMGKYTAKLVAVYDDGTRDVPLESTVTFWVVPVRLIAGTLLILSLPLIIGFAMGRRGKQKR